MLGLTRGSFSRESPQARIAQGTLDTGGHPEGPGRHLSWELKAGEEIGSEGEGCLSGTKESPLQRHLRDKGPRAAKGRRHAELWQETEERVAKPQFLQCGPGWAAGGSPTPLELPRGQLRGQMFVPQRTAIQGLEGRSASGSDVGLGWRGKSLELGQTWGCPGDDTELVSGVRSTDGRINACGWLGEEERGGSGA